MTLENSLVQALRTVEAAMREHHIVAIHITTEDDVYDSRGKVEFSAYDSLEQIEVGEEAPREYDKCESLEEAFRQLMRARRSQHAG